MAVPWPVREHDCALECQVVWPQLCVYFRELNNGVWLALRRGARIEAQDIPPGHRRSRIYKYIPSSINTIRTVNGTLPVREYAVPWNAQLSDTMASWA